MTTEKNSFRDLVGNASKRCNLLTVTLGKATGRRALLGNGVAHYVRRAAMLLLAVMTTATAWAYDWSQTLKSHIDFCKGGLESVCISGWIYDSFAKQWTLDNGIEVYAKVFTVPNEGDEKYDPSRDGDIEYVEREDVNAAFGLVGKHGFRMKINVFPFVFEDEQVRERTFYVKIYAVVNNGNGYEEILLNSPSVTVRYNEGDGEYNPYIINDIIDWYACADAIADADIGGFYSGCSYKLDNNFDNSLNAATRGLGTSTHPFNGTFDGNGKALRVGMSGDLHVAPFAYTDDATIKNLTVYGNISATQYAGGIVGHGGSNALTMENCVCSATISNFQNYAGGLVGWCDYLSLNLRNCLFKGSFSPGNGGKFHPIALTNPEASAMASAGAGVLYVNTSSPSEGLGNHLVPGALGIPVNTSQVTGLWTVPVKAVDGVTYYSRKGGLDFCRMLPGNIMVKGWAFDPNQPSESIDVEVHIYSDAACNSEVTNVLLHANHSRPDIIDTYGITGRHGFQDFIPIADAGTYYVKFIADLTGNDNQQIGDVLEVTVTTEYLGFVKNLIVTSIRPKGWNGYYYNSYFDYYEGSQHNYGEYSNIIAYQEEKSLGFNNDYITDLYLSNAPLPVPEELTYNGRTYYLAPYAGGNEIFRNYQGNLPGDFPGIDLHLYYTRDAFDDNRALTGIIVDTNTNGALGVNGDAQAVRINDGDGMEPCYLHFTTAKTISPFTHEPPYSFSFERPLDVEGWTTAGLADGTGITEGQYFHFNAATTSQYLLSSKFESGVPMKVTFNAKSNTSNTHFCIGYSKTGNGVSDFTWSEMGTGNNWQQLEYEIPTDTKYVAIKTIENTLDLDDFNFVAYYSFIPENLRLNNLLPFAATLTWDVPQTTLPIKEYAYQLKISTEDNWPEEVIVRGDLQSFNVNLTDLSCGTSYDFRVRTIYENGNSSKYANISFSTPNMPLPTNLYVSELTEQAATLRWSAPETEFTLTGYSYQYRKAENEDWSESVITTATTATISLEDRAHYTFRVKALYGGYESPYIFTTFYKMPYTYGFDKPLEEEGWKMVDNISDTGIHTDSYNHKKYFGFRLYRDEAPQYLVSPLLACPTFLSVAFTYGINAQGEEGNIQVGYSTTTDDIEAFTWDSKIFVSAFDNWYGKVFPKGVKYIAVKATFNSNDVNCYLKLDDFNFSVCDTPSPLNVVWDESREHSAQLTWTAPDTDNTITGYGYQYKKASDSNWSAEATVAANVTTVTLTNLATTTDYNFRVRTLYANNVQSIYLPFNFSTAWELPYECGFENGMNGMHTTDDFDNGFTYSTTGINVNALRSGTYGYRIYAHHTTKSQYLITPALSNTLVKKLTFYYTCGGMFFYERFQVGYSTTSDDLGAFIWDDEIATTNYETWTKYEKILPVACRYVAIKYNSINAFAIYIDDFTIEEYSNYQAPVNLVATDLPEEIATRLTWTAPSTQPTGYAYQYKKANDNTWSDLTTTDASTTTVTLSGLPVNTDYQFRVKALYAGGASNFETVTFISDAGIEPLPHEWGFEKGLGGFRVANNVRSSQVVHFIWHQGAFCFRFSPVNYDEGAIVTQPQYLVSPRFNCQSALRVSFYYSGGTTNDIFQVGYSTKTNNINDFEWGNREKVPGGGWHRYTCALPEGTKYVAIKWLPNENALFLDDFRFEGTIIVHLADNADNTATISNMDGSQNSTVYLDGRTLYRDGDWNTICLPFNLGGFSGTPLDAFEVKELDTNNTYNGHKTGIENGTLYLNFKNASSIVAGRPYIARNIKVAGADASLASYYALEGTSGYDGEDYQKLVDGTPETKWRSTAVWQTEGPWYCEFSTSDPIYVTGYALTGGFDIYDYPDRAPRIWKLKAKLDTNSDWITIDERNAEENNDAMPTDEIFPTNYYIAADKQGVYQFFRIEITKSGGENMQIGEIKLLGTLASSSVADITNPMFSGVTVSKVSPDERKVTSQDGRITFQGTYASQSFTSADQSILFLGAGNTLYWPEAGATIGAQRAFFQLNGLSAGQVNAARMFFGDEEETQGIGDAARLNNNEERINNKWYTVDGRKLDTKPTKKGLYIHGGKKVVIP